VEVPIVGEDVDAAILLLPTAPAPTLTAITGADEARRGRATVTVDGVITGLVLAPYASCGYRLLTCALSSHTIHHSSGKTSVYSAGLLHCSIAPSCVAMYIFVQLQ
jgi:hypothetical protein